MRIRIAVGAAHQSASDHRVHFGLGDAKTVQRVEVRWPGGTLQVLKDVPADRIMEIVEPASDVRQ